MPLLPRIVAVVIYSVALGQLRAAEPASCLVVAHRGLLLHAPENTLVNFRACLNLRLGFEFDVQRSKDGNLVCIHDDTVDRTTNGMGKVNDLSLAEIKRLDAGSWFDPKFAGENVPTVEEVLNLVAEHRRQGILVAVDLKAEDVERDVVQLADKLGVLDRLIFIGSTISNPAVRKNIKGASAKAQTATLASESSEFEQALAAANTDWVYLRFVPSMEQVEAVHRVRKRVFLAGPLFSGHTPDNWRQAVEVGADGILTDYSTELAAWLRENRGR
jgi:glycerophosphoryl diester phosphodiesterase